MDGLFQSLILVLCLAMPMTLLGIVIFAWMLGMGWLSIPGIGRRSDGSKADWITVWDLSGKLTKAIAVISGGAGSLLGFVGFLLPWVRLDVGAATNILGTDVGSSLGGQMSGVAIAFYSMVAGIKLLGESGAGTNTILTGLILIVFSLFVFIIPVLLGVLAAIGIGFMAVPLRLLRGRLSTLARMMLAMSLIASCAICGFFSLLQATIGGIGISGSVGGTGSMVAGIQPAFGFVMTAGGLLLAIFAAVTMISIVPAVEEWSRNLTELKQT